MSDDVRELRLVALTEDGHLDGAALAHVREIASGSATSAAAAVKAILPSREDVAAKLDAATFNEYIARNPAGGGNSSTPDANTPAAVQDNGDGTATIGSIRVPALVSGRFTASGRTAVLSAAQTGASYNVCSPEFGADPTGAQDSTAAIQAAIDQAAAAGGGAVKIPAGTYTVTYPFIQLKGYVTVYGEGRSTRIIATDERTVKETTGVFHTGTYATRLQDSECSRFGVHSLFIKTRSPEKRHSAPIPKICGIVYNTDLGPGPADPDAVPVLRNIEIWDTHIGVAVLGNDDQGGIFENVRIRHTLKQGMLVGKSSTHPEYGQVPGGPGAADNDLVGVDVSGANMDITGGCAGIEIYTSQTRLTNCKSWYNKRRRPWQDIYGLTTPLLSSSGALAGDYVTPGAEVTAGVSRNREHQHDGAGIYVKSTKNTFTACLSQENGGHGFVVEWGKNIFNGCISESSSWTDCVSLAARTHEAADFYICNDAQHSIFLGCRAESARKNTGGALYGFYIETYMKNLRVSNCMAQNHPVGANGKSGGLCIGSDVKENVRVEVDDEFVSTLARDRAVSER